MSNKIVVSIRWGKLARELGRALIPLILAVGAIHGASTSDNLLVTILLSLLWVLGVVAFMKLSETTPELSKLLKGTRNRAIRWSIIILVTTIAYGYYLFTIMQGARPITLIILGILIIYAIKILITRLIQTLNRDVEKKISNVSRKSKYRGY